MSITTNVYKAQGCFSNYSPSHLYGTKTSDGKASRLGNELLMLKTVHGGFISADKKDQLHRQGVSLETLKMIESTRGRLLGGAPGFDQLRDRYSSDPINVLCQAVTELKIPFTQNHISQVEYHIKKKDIAGLRTTFQRILEQEQITRLNEYLSKTCYKDLNTTLAQVIKQVQPEKNGIMDHRSKEKAWFVGKGLQCTDPGTGMPYGGIISSCEKDAEKLAFVVDNKRTVEIFFQVKEKTKEESSEGGDYCVPLSSKSGGEAQSTTSSSLPQSIKVVVTDKYKVLFSKLFSDNLLEKINDFDLDYKQGAVGIEGGIPAGLYKITQQDDKSWILEAAAGGNQYKVSLEKSLTQDKQTSEVRIFQGSSQEWLPIQGIDGFQFFHNCLLAYQSSKELTDINATNINDRIKINPQPEDYLVKLNYLVAIQKKTDELKAAFFQEENASLLHEVLSGIISPYHPSLYGIVRKHRPESLCKTVEMIAKEYQEGLGQEKSPDEIIREVAFEVNYQKLVNKDRNIEVAKTLNLIQEADKHIESLEGKDAVLFMGKTGAGKSTGVCYLLGAKMDHFTNNVGDPVVRLSEGEDPNKYPKIGQSLGQSETLYTTAFKLDDATHNPDGSVMFCDCPGFDDNRGGSYELCSNLSIDNVARMAKEIRSVVITLPANAFLSDRANSVIDTVETVRERFPFAFDIRNERKDAARIYVLITKGQQVPPETLAAIGDGTRVQELLQEANRALEKERSQDRVNDLMQTMMARRQLIWHSLSEMYKNSQVDVIDMADAFERGRLLEKYVAKGGYIDKTKYVKAMEGRDMQIKFGKSIEMATDSWAVHIIIPYMKELPEKIEGSKNTIQGQGKSLGQLDDEIKKYEEEVREKESKHAELSNGVHKEILWEEDYRGRAEETMDLRNVTKQQVKDGFDDLGGLPIDDEGVYRTVKLGEYKGRLVHLPCIEKKYALVPKDPEQRMALIGNFRGAAKVGDFEASLDGEHFEISLGMNSDLQGTRVCYSFDTIWRGDGKMPWIEISHTIPNSVRYEAQLANLQGRVNQLRANIAESIENKRIEQEKDIEGAKKQLREHTIKKRHLALAISEEWGAANLLYRFMCIAFGDSLTESHKKFKDTYEEYQASIKPAYEKDLEEWRKELGAPGQVDESSSSFPPTSGDNKRPLDEPTSPEEKKQEPEEKKQKKE